MSLVDLVLELHDHLSATGVSHSFGGALALAHIAEPRGTVNVDINVNINVFSPIDDLDETLATFAVLGFHPELSRAEWLPIAGIRLRRTADPYPVDVFPPLDTRPHSTSAGRVLYATPQRP